MREFTLQMLPWNVRFGAGRLATLPRELDALGLNRAIVLSTPEQADDAERVAGLLGDACVATFTGARMHVPREVAASAATVARDSGADCSVSIGGGSTTGLGKALALDPGIPLVAVPTTYAGSEMTNIWGMSEHGRKRTGRDLRVLPRLTIYDPELTLGLPRTVAGPSAMNALAQATVNAMDPRANPIITTLALEAIGAIASAVPRVMEAPEDLDARSELLYGASLAGAALGAGVTSLHHRICHVLGGSFDTPHAETHTVLLPYTVAYSAAAVPDRMRRIAGALGAEDAALGLHRLRAALDLPASLREIGIEETDLERITALVLETEVSNPRPVTREGLMELLRSAHGGRAPDLPG